MEFPKPEYWCGKPFPSPGDLPNPGLESRSLTLQVDSLPAEPQLQYTPAISLLDIYPMQELLKYIYPPKYS